MKQKSPVIALDNDLLDNLRAELFKAQKDPTKYALFLFSEIRFLAKEEFLQEQKTTLLSHYKRVNRGAELIGLLEELHKSEKDESLVWTRLIGFLVDYRTDQLKTSIWREKFRANFDKIQQGLFKAMPNVVRRRKVSEFNKNKAKVREKPFTSLTSAERTKEYKKEVLRSRMNAANTMRDHLKRLQKFAMIPNPYKLPYVKSQPNFKLTDLPDQRHGIPGAGKSSIIRKAYDTDIIKFVMEAEVEYRLNQVHFLDTVADKVNKRGPPKVKIVVTNAGIMPASFLRGARVDRRYMRAMAVDIKWLMRCSRKSLVWNLTPSDIDSIKESKHGEGYSVKGSRGFSDKELMYPRFYYEQLAVDEAIWEYLMEKSQNEQGKTDAQEKIDYNRLNYLSSSWTHELGVATDAVKAEINLYYTRHRALTKKLQEKREKVQEEENAYFETIVEKYKTLIQVLKEKNVFMHSDIYTIGQERGRSYEQIMQTKSQLKRKNWPGLPVRERFGSSLGDYLNSVGFKGFRMGNKFKKRHNIVKRCD